MSLLPLLFLAFALAAPPPAASSPAVDDSQRRAAPPRPSRPTSSGRIRSSSPRICSKAGRRRPGATQLSLEYVSRVMESMGLTPAAPGGGWIQKVPLVGITPKVPQAMTFSGPGGKRRRSSSTKTSWRFPGSQKPEAAVADAEVVFVGYGIVAPEYGWDDYKDVDVKGKVLLIMNNDPEDDPKLFAGQDAALVRALGLQVRDRRRQEGRRRRDHHPHDSLRRVRWNVVQTPGSGEKFELPGRGRGAARPDRRRGRPTRRRRRSPRWRNQDLDALRAAAQKRDFRPVPLGVRLSLALDEPDRPKVESGNVIGELPRQRPDAREASRALHRAPRPPREERGRQARRRRHLQRRPSTTRRASRRCSRSRGRTRGFRSRRAARSCSLRSRPRSRASSDPSTLPSTRRSPRGGSPRTSTSTG